MKYPHSEFWNYSTQIWSLGIVESSCIKLQNDYNINANILLYCCWAGDNGYLINEDNLQTLLNTAKPWQEIIEPLRESRKVMQHNLIAIPADELSQTISNIGEMEINTEHMAQLALEKALKLKKLEKTENKTSFKCSQNNIDTYINSLDEVTTTDVAEHISQILNALFANETNSQNSVSAS